MKRQASSGFSLVEVMVGLVIGLISSIVIFQVYAVAERQQRATAGAGDSQANGAIALQMIERDMRMAGWGAEVSTFAKCANVYSYYDNGSGTSGPDTSFSNLVASVEVTDGTTNAPDSLTIKYFANPSDADSIGYQPSMTTLRETMPSSSAELKVGSVYGCSADLDGNSLMLIQEGGNCSVMQVTQVQSASLKLQHNPGGSGATYNPPVSYQNEHNWPSYGIGATVQCLPNPQGNIYKRGYSIDLTTRSLRFSDASTTYEVAPQIVDLQAQYGVAATGSQQVTSWVNATDSWINPLTNTKSAQIKAVRIAVVARSQEYEKPDSSGACSATTTTQAASWSSWATFKPENYSTDWQCYRYKVFETVVPLRNIIWAKI